MLLPYELKAFAEQFNELKLCGEGTISMKKFAGTTTDITLKITTHGDVQFISLMQY